MTPRGLQTTAMGERGGFAMDGDVSPQPLDSFLIADIFFFFAFYDFLFYKRTVIILLMF